MERNEPPSSGSIVVGVDVGGPKKGFHAVALQAGQYRERLSTLMAVEIAECCRMLNASVVGIDAPCQWSRTGRARPCERELAKVGIHAFATPSREKAECHPFYRWMLKGADLYHLLTPHYPLFDGCISTSGPFCFETFPQAVACALAKRILPAREKRRDRSRLLDEAGVSTGSLTNMDMVDAALCALTAHHLFTGKFGTYGDPAEGFIVVPKI